MILDAKNTFMDNLDVKATRQAGTTIDLGADGPFRDALAGAELTLRIQVTAAFTRAAGAIGSTFSLQTHTADDFSADRTVLWQSASLAKATLIAGYIVARVRVPVGCLRYLSVVVVNANAADAANADAFLIRDDQNNTL